MGLDWIGILNLLIGGLGLASFVVAMVTIRASRKKANAEADGAVVETEHKMMSLAKDYVDEFKENVHEPLLKEMKGLRRDVKNLRNAISKVNNCPHVDDCPVRYELQKQQEADNDNSDR